MTIIRVTDEGKRQALRGVAGGQRYVEEAPEFLVFCADLSRSMRCCEMNGGKAAEGLTEQFIIATVDTALYAQNLVVAAESAGLGICYIGALRNDPATVTRILDCRGRSIRCSACASATRSGPGGEAAPAAVGCDEGK